MKEQSEGFSTSCQYAYVAFFSFGIGPISWVYGTEIFPFDAEGTRTECCWSRCEQASSLALAIGFQKMPVSPRWLVMQGRLGEAKKILSLVSNTKEEAEFLLGKIMAAAGMD
ncbi:hypothetical protein ACE6H2_024608 [Prunus campanulata]